MYRAELKSIELLMRQALTNSNLRSEVLNSFSEPKTFENARFNLFNYISINDFLTNYTDNPPFSLESYLFTGIIPGLFEDKIATPDVDPKYFNNYQEFYHLLIKALKENNYIFDDEHHLFISSEDLEVTIPEIWLYRIATALKKTTHKEFFLYNKNAENNIYDRNSLIDYIRHTKTFLVTLSSSNPNFNYAKTYNDITTKTLASIEDKRKVNVSDLMATFISNAPSDCDVQISRYKLSDAFWLVMKADNLGPEFYNEPLEVQKKMLNSWLLEYINSNEIANRETQRHLLTSSLDPNVPYLKEDIPSKNIIVGLFNLYISLINNLEIDFNSISLTDFRLHNYLTSNMQDNLTKLSELIKSYNTQRDKRIIAKEEASKALAKLQSIDSSEESDKYQKAQAKYEKALNLYQEEERLENEYGLTRNQLQTIIDEEHKTSLTELAFDNDKIMSLILQATKTGRIYLNKDNKTLYIELYNDEIGKCIFKVSISMNKLLELMSTINHSFDSYGYQQR